jgi:3-keto-5-aminohexanoate cleavage enzyme
MPKVFIECALNGAWTRERQPAIPVTRDAIISDGIAAAKAGAAIIHLHAYDETTGRQKDDYDLYAPLIEGIRAKCDAIVYPTLPITGSGYAGELRSAKERYMHLEKLAQNGLAEWGVIDPGSAVFTRFDEIARGEAGYTYYNPDDHFYEGMRIGAQYGVRPSYAIYEAGCTRLGAAKAKQSPRVPVPVYRFMFAEEFCFGFPPKAAYLDTHLALLAQYDPGAPWMVAGLGVDVRPLIAPAVERGGHIRVGLEDRPWGVAETNRGLVEEAVRLVQAAGGDVATAADARAACAAVDNALRRGAAHRA